MKIRKFLIIAHYHREGKIRTDLIKLIKLFNKSFEKIVFISTNLKKNEKIKIQKYAKIITRPNYGYDFYSWKVGINFFKKKFINNFGKNKILFLLPSSLLYVKPYKLLREFNRIKNFNNKVFSLTKSWEVCQHIQSDILIFALSLFEKKQFSDWWNKIKKFKSRQIIIFKYEIGFSKFLDNQNIKALPIFNENIKDYPFSIFKLFKSRILNIFFKIKKIHKKNPTHFYWNNIYQKYGLIKIELIKSNPHKVNIDKFNKIFNTKKNTKLYLEAINN